MQQGELKVYAIPCCHYSQLVNRISSKCSFEKSMHRHYCMRYRILPNKQNCAYLEKTFEKTDDEWCTSAEWGCGVFSGSSLLPSPANVSIQERGYDSRFNIYTKSNFNFPKSELKYLCTYFILPTFSSFIKLVFISGTARETSGTLICLRAGVQTERNRISFFASGTIRRLRIGHVCWRYCERWYPIIW